MSGRREPRQLGFSFVPLPTWIEDAWEAGSLSDEAERLHRVLWRRASADAIVARAETPRLRLETLADVLTADRDAVRKLLSRERERGRLDYRHEGSPRAGFIYVFRLFPDGPRLSGGGPPNEGEPVRESAEGRPARQAGSRPEPGGTCPAKPEPRSVELSAKGSDLSANHQASGPLHERDCVDGPASPVRDVKSERERATALTEEVEDVVGEGTRAVGDSTQPGLFPLEGESAPRERFE